jgi:hypothetical protein
MAKRKVFGRIQLTISGQTYKFEMRESGLWIRKHKSRREWLVPLSHLIRLVGPQTELFPPDNAKATNIPLGKSNEVQPVQDLPEGLVVPGRS